MSAVVASAQLDIASPRAAEPPASQSTSTFHALPTEVLERVLTFSDPRDVSRVARTCRFAHKLIYEPSDHYLWRELYLGRPFDDLRLAVPVPKGRRRGTEMDESDIRDDVSLRWHSELQRRIQAELIAASNTRDARLLQTAYEAFLAAIETARPLSQDEGEGDGKASSKEDMSSQSENLRWLDRVLRKTRVLDRVPAYTGAIVHLSSFEHLNDTTSGSESTTVNGNGDDCHSTDQWVEDCPLDSSDLYWLPERFREVHQMRSRLRACVGLSHENSFELASRERMGVFRRVSRAFVYDMRKYQKRTLWGPFRTAADGRTLLVDWEHVEHIINVVGLKLREIPLGSLGYYKKPLFHMDALRAYSAVGALECPEGDWAGVTGRWRRFVCFMDYRDLYMFNYSLLPPGPHDPSFFDDPFDEALRPVELQFTLISRDEYFSEPQKIAIDPSVNVSSFEAKEGSAPISDYEDPAFPTLYFKGHSHGAAATVRGKVSTLSDGAIRWQFVTIYDGRLQWSAEAVQIAHVCSAAGVAGIWTGAHHDRDDPAGPFWMVKVNGQLPTGILNTLH